MTNQIVKICGLKTVEAAEVAIESGSNLLGTILVPNRERTVEWEVAKQIGQLCKEARKERQREFVDSRELLKHVRESDLEGSDWFEYVAKKVVENGPYLVGVFRNQSLEEVQDLVENLDLDLVQLHGSEDFAMFVEALDVPVIARYVLNKENIKDSLVTHKHLLPLLDSEAGGEGKLIDWNDAKIYGEQLNGRYILAGGLTPENVKQALRNTGTVGVDVSGGVETDKHKDMAKIKAFVENAQQAYHHTNKV